MTEMNQHFQLTKQEFYESSPLFNTLEIRKEQVVDQNYQYLSKYLKEQYKKLLLVNHSNKGGNDIRCEKIIKAYRELTEYIEPLKSGNPCVSNRCLSEREFYYRNKLFAQLNITKEEVVQKTFSDILNVLCSKEEKFKRSQSMDMSKSYHYLKRELENYISPLVDKRDLIEVDKAALSAKFVKHYDEKKLLWSLYVDGLFSILSTVTICGYLSCWIIAFDIVIDIVRSKIMRNYETKFRNLEISHDEYTSKTQYIVLGSKFLFYYPLAAFSVYLLATNFIANGITIGGIILGPLVALAIVMEVLSPIFHKGCEIYVEKHIRDLREEDPRDRIQKETDLLKWYDLRLLLMPIIMSIVRKCFMELSHELAERNFDEVNTNMSDVRSKQQEMTTDIPV